MSTMNEYSWDVGLGIVVIFAELTGVLIDEFGNEFLDFGVLVAGYVLSLSEEEGGWVLEFFHCL